MKTVQPRAILFSILMLAAGVSGAVGQPAKALLEDHRYTEAIDQLRAEDGSEAAFGLDPANPQPNETVTFDASGSDDLDEDLQSYEWEFGDGAPGSGETTDHTYDEAGSYAVLLTVTDDAGQSDTETKIVEVDGTPPQVQNATLTDQENSDGTVSSGDQVQVSAEVSDGGGSGVESVAADVSAFDAGGNDGTVTLTDGDDNGTYETTFTVGENASEGDQSADVTATDGAGNSATETTDALTIDATPPQVQNATLTDQSEQASEVLSVEADASAFDAGGSDNTVELTDEDDDGTYEATVTVGENASGGNQTVTVTATDEAGNSATAETSVLTVRPAQLQASVTQSFGGDQEEDYQLVALPGQANGTLSETISGSDWRGFQETGASGGQAYSRQECSGGCQFGPGVGFWLITGESWQVDRTVQTVDLNGEGTVQIPLQNGWNAVSNPLEEDLSWGAVQEASGTNQPLHRWSGASGWEEVSTFKSAMEGEAYYFRDDQISALTVPYPGAGGSSAQGKPQAKADTAQVEGGARRALTLSVASGGEAVTSVRAGVRPEAEEGLDRFDHYGPPGYFGPATLRLMQHRNSGEEGEERPVALATEYRGPGGEGYSYDLRLRASADTALTLQAGGLSEFEGEQVSLVETATGEAHALQEGEEITILQRTAEARYRLLVGSTAYVEAKTEDLRPSEVKLLPNYPNPFARQTTIEYALPEAQAVRLAVYDVLGRQVAVLQDGKQEGGFHWVQWQAGGGLSSGTYFLRLTAGGQTQTQRVTVLR